MTAHPQTPAPAGEQRSSATKVLTVLTAMLRSGQTAVTLTELALAVGLPKSTTHRLLKELEDQGFVTRARSLYRLGDAFLDLAETARWSRHEGLRDVASASLTRLFEDSEAVAVHLAVLRGRSILYLDKLMRAGGSRLPTRVGGRFPAACTGLGKAMLSVCPPEAL
jgi:IclR family transcriptional regulator, acetate operon repressor